jgi:hypothetical protein
MQRNTPKGKEGGKEEKYINIYIYKKGKYSDHGIGKPNTKGKWLQGANQLGSSEKKGRERGRGIDL